MERRFYDLTSEITECQTQSSAIYKAPPRFKGRGQRPSAGWEGCQGHGERRAREMGSSVTSHLWKTRIDHTSLFSWGPTPQHSQRGQFASPASLVFAPAVPSDQKTHLPSLLPSPAPGPPSLTLHSSLETSSPPRKPALIPAPPQLRWGPS